jgi:hypothetical protein
MAKDAIRPTKITGNVFIFISLFLSLRFVFPFFPCLNRLVDALRAKPQLPFALQNLLRPEAAIYPLCQDPVRNWQ